MEESTQRPAANERREERGGAIRRAGATLLDTCVFLCRPRWNYLQLNNDTIIHAVIRLSTAATGSVFVHQLCGPVSVSAADIGAVSIR